MRRAASTEADDKQSPLLGRRLGHHSLNRNGSLQKKSLSLDQSMNKDQVNDLILLREVNINLMDLSHFS